MSVRIPAALADELHRQADAARWRLPVDAFAAALARSAARTFAGRSPSPGELRGYLESLRLAELALASACEAGSEEAWDHFVLEYRPVLYRAADAMEPGGGARDLADSLYAELYGVRDHGGERRSLFSYFHGRSSLATWLRAVLAQRRIDRARADRRTAPLPDHEPAAPAAEPPDPDRRRLAALVHGALRAAVAALDARERLRLCYYYAQGLTLAEAGRLLGEHEASVSRHLAATRKGLRRTVEQALRGEGLGPAEVERAFQLVSDDPGAFDLDALLTANRARNPEAIVPRTGRSVR